MLPCDDRRRESWKPEAFAAVAQTCHALHEALSQPWVSQQHRRILLSQASCTSLQPLAPLLLSVCSLKLSSLCHLTQLELLDSKKGAHHTWLEEVWIDGCPALRTVKLELASLRKIVFASSSTLELLTVSSPRLTVLGYKDTSDGTLDLSFIQSPLKELSLHVSERVQHFTEFRDHVIDKLTLCGSGIEMIDLSEVYECSELQLGSALHPMASLSSLTLPQHRVQVFSLHAGKKLSVMPALGQLRNSIEQINLQLPSATTLDLTRLRVCTSVAVVGCTLNSLSLPESGTLERVRLNCDILQTIDMQEFTSFNCLKEVVIVAPALNSLLLLPSRSLLQLRLKSQQLTRLCIDVGSAVLDLQCPALTNLELNHSRPNTSTLSPLLLRCPALRSFVLGGGKSCTHEDCIGVSAPALVNLDLSKLSRICHASMLQVQCVGLSDLKLPSHPTWFVKITLETPMLSQLPLLFAAEHYYDHSAMGKWELSFMSSVIQELPLCWLQSLRACQSFKQIDLNCPRVTTISARGADNTITCGGLSPIAHKCALRLHLPTMQQLSLRALPSTWSVTFRPQGLREMANLTLHEVNSIDTSKLGIILEAAPKLATLHLSNLDHLQSLHFQNSNDLKQIHLVQCSALQSVTVECPHLNSIKMELCLTLNEFALTSPTAQTIVVDLLELGKGCSLQSVDVNAPLASLQLPTECKALRSLSVRSCSHQSTRPLMLDESAGNGLLAQDLMIGAGWPLLTDLNLASQCLRSVKLETQQPDLLRGLHTWVQQCPELRRVEVLSRLLFSTNVGWEHNISRAAMRELWMESHITSLIWRDNCCGIDAELDFAAECYSCCNTESATSRWLVFHMRSGKIWDATTEFKATMAGLLALLSLVVAWFDPFCLQFMLSCPSLITCMTYWTALIVGSQLVPGFSARVIARMVTCCG